MIFFTFTSCKPNQKKALNKNAFFGGEIINRSSNYLILKHNKTFIDSIAINDNGWFEYRLDNAQHGLYYYHHGRELQSVLIEPGDSLLLRLNTYDFDESVVYSGIGAKQNNYLMDLFLKNEKEVKDITTNYSQLDPFLFEEKMNHLKTQKLNRLEKFNSKNNTTKLFQKIALAHINYSYYNAKEIYPFANYKKNKLEIFNQLPEDFYNYRSQVNFNNTLLEHYTPYHSFLRLHIKNLALENHYKQSKDSIYDEYSLAYNLEKLKTIDQLIKNESIKNTLLNYTTLMFINGSQNTLDYEPILKSFIEKNTDPKLIAEAKQLVKTYQRLKPGEPLPNITLISNENKEYPIFERIKKPTIIYFWDLKNKNHLIESHKHIEKLKLKYPKFDVLAISINDISSKEQYQILKRLNLPSQNEFRFKLPNKAINTLALKPIHNVFLVDEHAKIINPKANMFHIYFEELLANYH